MTALALSRRGLRARVLEGAPRFGAIGYGIQFGPNVFHVLDRLGLMEPVLAIADAPSVLCERAGSRPLRLGAEELAACDPSRLIPCKRFGRIVAQLARSVVHDEAGVLSSTVHGGGKRRPAIISSNPPRLHPAGFSIGR